MEKGRYFVKKRVVIKVYKEIIVSIVIIIGIVILNNITENYTKDSLEIMSKDFNEIRGELLKEDQQKEFLISKVEEMKSSWDNRSQKLAYYIEHDELEKVDTYLTALKSNIETKEYEQAVENLDICEYILDHIDDKEAFLLKNIF